MYVPSLPAGAEYMQLIGIECSSSPEATRMSQEHFGRTSPAAAPPKPRRLYRLPDADDYADNGSDSHAPALHVSKVYTHYDE